MMRACSYCGGIHPVGYECPKKPKRNYRGGEERKLRSTHAWTEKSLEIRRKAQGLCEVCKDQGVITYKGLEVHHITKLAKDNEGLLDDYNLICLCVPHHKQADAGEIPADYLRKLVKERENANDLL